MSTVRVFRRGDTGPEVVHIRAILTRLGMLPSGAAGDFDDDCDHAVRAFQQARGLSADGLVGPDTLRALDEARWTLGDRILTYSTSRMLVGDDVADLQRRLADLGFDPGRCDGMFGRRTDEAVREFQRNIGIASDGTCGPETVKALGRLVKAVVGGRPTQLREAEAHRRTAGGPAGKRVVIDPGHGGSDTGAVAGTLTEAEICHDLATRLEGRLATRGMSVFLSRGRGNGPSEPERADFANEIDADLVISIHVDASASAACNGVATFYYGGSMIGGSRTGSAIGRMLADLVQASIVSRTDLTDAQVHGRTWDLLRRTRMPAVRVELGYLTSPKDSTRLADAGFRDTVADAIADAVSDLFRPRELDLAIQGSAALGVDVLG
jgi:N-acetylmuramoyl-L-alanine amidase